MRRWNRLWHRLLTGLPNEPVTYRYTRLRSRANTHTHTHPVYPSSCKNDVQHEVKYVLHILAPRIRCRSMDYHRTRAKYKCTEQGKREKRMVCGTNLTVISRYRGVEKENRSHAAVYHIYTSEYVQ